jgi:D-aminoacyl-tRNA deacylase
MTSTAPATAAVTSINANPAIRMVLQRVNTAALLVDNISRRVVLKNQGIICHIAMFDGVNETHIPKAVKLITESKLYAFGTVGENAARPKPISLVEDPTVSLMIIPQASIAGRVKGKTAQYHSQCSKDIAQDLYNLFISSLRKALLPAEILDKLDVNGELIAENNNNTAKEDNINDDDQAEGKNIEKKKQPELPRYVLNGTYGNTQALSFDSSGPMTHVLDVEL